MVQRKRPSSGGETMQFIVSDEKRPSVALKPGMRLEVTSVTLVNAQLKKPKSIGARLCGGSGTCLALVQVGHEAVVNPVLPKRASGDATGASARRRRSS
jgi:hypothetical protein